MVQVGHNNVQKEQGGANSIKREPLSSSSDKKPGQLTFPQQANCADAAEGGQAVKNGGNDASSEAVSSSSNTNPSQPNSPPDPLADFDMSIFLDTVQNPAPVRYLTPQ